jgi:hypothetical protein
MTSKRSPAVKQVLWLLALAMIVAVMTAAIGYYPTTRIGGRGAVVGMLAGCAISLIGSFVGSIPIVLALHGPARRMPQAVLTSTALRFLVVLLLALSAALSGWFDRAPLLVWVAISYVLLLAVDTVFAVRLSGGNDSESLEK